LGVGNSSGIVPPVSAIALLTFHPTSKYVCPSAITSFLGFPLGA